MFRVVPVAFLFATAPFRSARSKKRQVLIHISKLAQIEQHAAEVLEAVGLGVGVKGGHFLGGGRAAGCELMGAPDLAFQSF